MSFTKLKTAPTAPILTTQEAKDHLHETLVSVSNDTYIDALVKSATLKAENFLQRKLITQTWTYYADNFPLDGYTIEIPFGKIQSLTSVKYYDSNGTLTTIDPSQYQVDLSGELSRVVPAVDLFSWPSTQAYKINAVEIEFVCGYGAASTNVPADIVEAIKFMVADWYTNREDESKISRVAENMLWPYRLVSFGC